jgi:long-chain acyl-CoA synthetase
MTNAILASLAARRLLAPPFSMAKLLAHSAAQSPDAIWLDGKDGSWTYDEGLGAARRFGTALIRQGVRPGDRVAMCMTNSPAAVIALHAIWQAGAVPALLHPAYAPDIQRAQIQLVSPRLLIGNNERSEQLAEVTRTRFLRLDEPPASDSDSSAMPPVESPVDELALLQFTGGTTGAPKAAMLTHGNLSAGLAQIALALPTLVAGEECSVAIAPFSHITGLNGVLGLMTYLRGRLIVPPPAPSELANACVDADATYLAGPPTMLTALVQAQEAGALDYRLRNVIAGGAPLPADVKKRFEEATGATVFDGYGLSETAPAVSLGGQPVAATSVEIRSPDSGTPLPCGSVGEICVSGPQVMQGYWRNEEASVAVLSDGLLHTGDLGILDGDGRLTIVDRLKEIIIASGYNVYPSRVEDAICSHPAVLEAAVVGLPDAYRGETVVAAIALRGSAELDLEGLTAFLSGRLSPMEMPRKLVIWDELPKSPAGKILRRSVRAGMEDAHKEDGHRHGTHAKG